MPKSLRYALLILRDLLTSAGPFVLAAILLLWLAYSWLNPTPPKRVTLATGPNQSAYAEFGARYAKAPRAAVDQARGRVRLRLHAPARRSSTGFLPARRTAGRTRPRRRA